MTFRADRSQIVDAVTTNAELDATSATEQALWTYQMPAFTTRPGAGLRLTAWGTTGFNIGDTTFRLWRDAGLSHEYLFGGVINAPVPQRSIWRLDFTMLNLATGGTGMDLIATLMWAPQDQSAGGSQANQNRTVSYDPDEPHQLELTGQSTLVDANLGTRLGGLLLERIG